MPADVILQPGVLIVTMVAYIVVLAAVCDSFPGERERHTIETLLASALPDEALLLGKILASVIYGWGLVLILLITILIGANVKNYPAMYPLSTILAALVVTPLSLILFSTAGVLLLHEVADRARRPAARHRHVPRALHRQRRREKFMPDQWRSQAKTLMGSESSLHAGSRDAGRRPDRASTRSCSFSRCSVSGALV